MSVSNFQITYQAAGQEDIPAIFSMSKALIDQYEDIASIDYQKVLQWVQNKITENIRLYQCIYANGEKAGYFRLILGEMEAELDDLYVLPAFRNQGIGTAVLQHCVSITHTPIFLYVFKNNSEAIKLYSRIGFSVSEEVGKTRYILRREVDIPY